MATIRIGELLSTDVARNDPNVARTGAVETVKRDMAEVEFKCRECGFRAKVSQNKRALAEDTILSPVSQCKDKRGYSHCPHFKAARRAAHHSLRK
jgi:hypothetical protein